MQTMPMQSAGKVTKNTLVQIYALHTISDAVYTGMALMAVAH